MAACFCGIVHCRIQNDRCGCVALLFFVNSEINKLWYHICIAEFGFLRGRVRNL